ncbi:hypothetical protein GCK32_022851 [Trichostrongylus colubriformis]|uniref:Uncharacterized protein n=1 Tax=Trichostrongylus colubriformis TaxID=6319 RepID=A0AAN8IP79_TRICO
MNATEISFLLALLTVFYITVIHPFMVASCIMALVGYVRYVAPKMDPPKDERIFSKLGDSTMAWHTAESELHSEEEKSTEDHSQPSLKLKKKSQREILAEVKAAQREREKYSKLLLTHQVPNMTAYFENLVRVIQQ